MTLFSTRFFHLLELKNQAIPILNFKEVLKNIRENTKIYLRDSEHTAKIRNKIFSPK